MVELCCYAAPIDVEIASKSPICTEFFNTYRAMHSLTSPALVESLGDNVLIHDRKETQDRIPFTVTNHGRSLHGQSLSIERRACFGAI